MVGGIRVFGPSPAAGSAEEVRTPQERRKRAARSGRDPLGTLPAALPALSMAYRRDAARAGDLGFDWERDADVVGKIREELAEWQASRDAEDHAGEEHEIGDLLLSVVNLARRRKIDPESALRRANTRFRRRFAEVARRAKESGRDVGDVGMEELDRYWEEAKKGE
jgi:ATP diphosphatase